MTITVSTTDKRDGKALALFARCSEWQTGHTKDGRSFFAIPGSERGLYHMADGRECSCADFRNRAEACKHIRAVRLWLAAFKTGAVALKPRPAGEGEIDTAFMALSEDKRVLRETTLARLHEVARQQSGAIYQRLYGQEED